MGHKHVFGGEVLTENMSFEDVPVGAVFTIYEEGHYLKVGPRSVVELGILIPFGLNERTVERWTFHA